MTRRGSLVAMGVTAACLALPGGARGAPAPAPTRGHHAPRIAYFNDGLLTDTSGQLAAHRRPAGYGGARGAARLDAAARYAAGLPV